MPERKRGFRLWSSIERRGSITPATSYLMLAPLLTMLVGAYFLPIAQLLLTSFGEKEWSLRNYQRLLDQPLYLEVIGRTIFIALAATVLCLVMAYPVAILMTRTKSRLSKIALLAVMIPLWTSVLVRSYAWILLLDRQGIINNALTYSGIISAPLRLLYTEWAVLVAMAHVLLPFMVLPIYQALSSIPKDLSLAAANLGATETRAFAEVVFPMSLNGVFAGCVIVFVMSLGFYITPALVGGPKILMIATLISQQAIELLDWPFAAALSFVLLVLSLGITIAFKRLLKLDKVTAND